MKILVADDTAMNLALAAKLLSRKGHEVVTAEDGLQAFTAFQKDSFDVVLMDVQMPRMDGLEATRKIRQWEEGQSKTTASESRQRVPIIALTANDEPHFLQIYLDAGMDGVITKPLAIKTLISTIQSIVEKSKST